MIYNIRRVNILSLELRLKKIDGTNYLLDEI